MYHSQLQRTWFGWQGIPQLHVNHISLQRPLTAKLHPRSLFMNHNSRAASWWVALTSCMHTFLFNILSHIIMCISIHMTHTWWVYQFLSKSVIIEVFFGPKVSIILWQRPIWFCKPSWWVDKLLVNNIVFVWESSVKQLIGNLYSYDKLTLNIIGNDLPLYYCRLQNLLENVKVPFQFTKNWVSFFNA